MDSDKYNRLINLTLEKIRQQFIDSIHQAHSLITEDVGVSAEIEEILITLIVELSDKSQKLCPCSRCWLNDPKP